MGFNIERADKPFVVKSPYKPSGDQPQAIAELAERIENGENDVVLMGATGTGKTATTAWLIEKLQRPTLIIEPNKTLAAQLCAEFRELMPDNAVSYFVSYYDYYQPEAYIPQTDTYIEKDSNINDDVERLRHQATANLLTRRGAQKQVLSPRLNGAELFVRPFGRVRHFASPLSSLSETHDTAFSGS